MEKDFWSALATIAGVGLLGMAKFASINPHTGRVRVNFNINRSTLSNAVPPKERYYQYSVYGNPFVINHSTSDVNIKEISEKDKGHRTNWSELVCLKDVTVWCDIKRMKAFHAALKQAKINAAKIGLTFPQPEFFGYIDKFLAGQHEFQNNTRPKGTVKDPFCFLEGKLVSYGGGEFEKELKSEGFSFDSPTGIARFNPRDSMGQPPGFLFDEISTDPNKIKGVRELQFLIGAKFACLTNSIASPFKPVYLWGPCVCDQSQVWNPFTTTIKSFKGIKGNILNTYELYMDTLKKCKNLRKNSRYSYYGEGEQLQNDYFMPKNITEKNKSGKIVMENGVAIYQNKPIRQFIEATYPIPQGSLSKKNKKRKNIRRKPTKKKKVGVKKQDQIRQKIINRAVEIYNKNFGNKMGSDPAGTCAYWAVAGVVAAREFGRNWLIQAGDASWKFIPDRLDDGRSPNYFGYVFSPHTPQSIMSMRMGNLPEVHVWMADSERGEIIDFSTYEFPGQAKRIQNYDWKHKIPPQRYWATMGEYNSNVDSHYVPREEAILRYVIPILVNKGYIEVTRQGIFPGHNLEL
jgi:hypothetical protein